MNQDHDLRYERDWLQVLTEVAEEVQRALSVRKVAEVVVDGGRRLGFERARLWLLAEDGGALEGVSQAGNQGLDDFLGFRVPVAASPYMQRVLESHDPVFFQGQELGESYLRRHHAARGYQAPTGEWVGLSLRMDQRCLGLLILDNASKARALRPEQRALLRLFGRQVAAALERARLYEEERRQSDARDWLKTLTEVAEEAQRALEVREVAGAVVRGGQRLGFERARLWRLSDDGRSFIGVSEAGNQGLQDFAGFAMPFEQSFYGEHMPRARDPQFFQGAKQGIGYLGRHFAGSGFEPPVGEWVNMPLWAGDRLWGVLALDNARQPRELRPEQRDLLRLFGRQVAAALERARLYKREKERLQIQYERDWLQVLTEVAEDAQRALSVREVADIVVSGGRRLGFERARLWLLDADGRTAVGVSERGNDGLEGFNGFRLPLIGSVYSDKVLSKHEPLFFQGRDRGPAYLDDHFATQGFKPPVGEWVELPLWNGERCLGMLALDNASQPREFRPEQRDLLSLFGRQIAAALERVQLHEREQRRSYERDWLKTLTEVAEDAQRALSVREVADIVVGGGRRLGFERARLWQLSDDAQIQTGLSQAGNEGLDDFPGFRVPVAASPYFAVLKLREPQFFDGPTMRPGYFDRHFAKRGFEPPVGEWVEMPLWNGERCLGTLTLDNARQPIQLRVEQRDLLRLFGRQVAAALDRAQLYEREKERRQLEAALDIAESVAATFDLSEVLRRILLPLSQLFPDARPFMLIYNEIEHSLDFREEFRPLYPIDNLARQGLSSVAIDEPSIVGRAARRSLKSKAIESENVADVQDDPDYLKLITSTRSEICVTLMSNDRLIGVLALESPRLGAFGPEDEQLVYNVGRRISIALDRATQLASLHFRATITDLTTLAPEVTHDMSRELYAIRSRISWLRDEPLLSADARRYIGEIDESADRLSETIRDVDLWNIQRRERMILDERLGPWVGGIVKKASAHVAVQFDLGCPDLKVEAHPIVLQRILLHLVRNALRAMGGSGALTVQTRPLRERWIELRIADTGPGVPAALRSIIFQRPMPARGGEGGWGLLLVRSYVEEMKGTIRLLPPEDDQGATFAIILPCVQAQSNKER